jgi:hypothetical protein
MGAGSKCDRGLIMPNSIKRREPSSLALAAMIKRIRVIHLADEAGITEF